MNLRLIPVFFFAWGALSPSAHATDYCAARSSYSMWEWIAGVTVNGLPSLSPGSPYTLFSSPVFQMKPGTNTVTLSPGFSGSSYTEYWAVYIDLNQDGVFSASERLVSGSSRSSVTTNFSIPTTARSGPTRMRVELSYGGLPAACGTFSYGEVEDYTVNIQPSAPTTVTSSTIEGFNSTPIEDLVILANFYRNGLLLRAASFFTSTNPTTKAISIEADIGSQIVWSAQTYANYLQAGTPVPIQPVSCTNMSGSTCTTLAGQTGQSVIFAGPLPPPPPPTVASSTTAGFNATPGIELVVLAKFSKNGVLYNSSNFYTTAMSPTRAVSIEADIGSQIEWSAHTYDPTGIPVDLQPVSCSSASGLVCLTQAGQTGQSVIFAAPSSPPPPPPPPAVDQTLTFENLFGGATYHAGPSILIDGVTATTSHPYFYSPTGGPFTSGFFGFIDLTLTFPAPVANLTFQAAGTCTNCTQTIQVTADGQSVGSFTLDYNVIKDIVLPLPAPATSVHFSTGFSMDNLGIDYQ